MKELTSELQDDHYPLPIYIIPRLQYETMINLALFES